MDEERRRVHIRKHAEPGNPHTFLDQKSMRRIRWEEDVVRARARREGVTDPIVIAHYSCSCGSYECLGTPIDRTPRRRRRR